MSEKKRFPYGATLGYLVTGSDVLLARKPIKKGEKVAEGLYNGLGGAIEKGETPEECLLRELTEETGYMSLPEHLSKIALATMNNRYADGECMEIIVHVFLVHRWWGKLRISRELEGLWLCHKDNLPFDAMMPIDRYWLPLALSGHRVLVRGGSGPGFTSIEGPVHVTVVTSDDLLRS